MLALLTAAAGYRPTIRLDLLGRDGLALALAYDRQQAAWGDPRRAFVTGNSQAACRHQRRQGGITGSLLLGLTPRSEARTLYDPCTRQDARTRALPPTV